MAKIVQNTVFDIYEKVAADIQSSGCDALLEPIAMMNQCCAAISRASLAELSDEDFAASLYFKLLDRPPRIQDIRTIVGRLASGKTGRDDELERVMNSEEYRIKNVNFKLVA